MNPIMYNALFNIPFNIPYSIYCSAVINSHRSHSPTAVLHKFQHPALDARPYKHTTINLPH